MRNNLITGKPWLPLLLTCAIVALIAWIRRGLVADVQLYDTYFVFEIHLLAGILITIMLVTSLLYRLTSQRNGLRQLTAAHVLGTIGLAIYIVSSAGHAPEQANITMSFAEYKAWQDANARFAMALVALGSVQMLFVANLIAKWVKG
ncbi:MAG: hypothetical protein ACO1N1_20980 [Dyadobacter fermentans]